MAEISPEVVERMVALVRKIAASQLTGTLPEARALVGLLPEPVDPDLIEAREITAAINDRCGYTNLARQMRDGERDGTPDVNVALAAIKRGRELERAK